MNWSFYRTWKHVVFPALFIAGGFALRSMPEGSLASKVGLAILVALALGYVAEEILWSWRGKGRPCRHCGRAVRMKSFRVRNLCPDCGGQL